MNICLANAMEDDNKNNNTVMLHSLQDVSEYARKLSDNQYKMHDTAMQYACGSGPYNMPKNMDSSAKNLTAVGLKMQEQMFSSKLLWAVGRAINWTLVGGACLMLGGQLRRYISESRAEDIISLERVVFGFYVGALYSGYKALWDNGFKMYQARIRLKRNQAIQQKFSENK